MRRRFGAVEQQPVMAGGAPYENVEMPYAEHREGIFRKFSRKAAALVLAGTVSLGAVGCGDGDPVEAKHQANASAEAKPTKLTPEQALENYHAQLEASLQRAADKYADDTIDPGDKTDREVALEVVQKASDFMNMGATEENYKLWQQLLDAAAGTEGVPNMLDIGPAISSEVAKLTEDKGLFKDINPDTMKIINKLRANNITCTFNGFLISQESGTPVAYDPKLTPTAISQVANVENRTAWVKVEHEGNSAACENQPGVNFEEVALPDPAYAFLGFKRMDGNEESKIGTSVKVAGFNLLGYTLSPTDDPVTS